MSNDFIDVLKKRLTIFDGHILTYDEVMIWPPGKLDELVDKGVVREAATSESVECVECPEKCMIVPDLRQHPETGELVGMYVCHQDEDIGRFFVDLNRKKRWEVVTQKPKKRKRQKKNIFGEEKKTESSFRPWDKKEKACFVHDSGKIRFFYKKELKLIPFRKDSQAPLILTAFIEGSLTGEEIKKFINSKLSPSQIVKNINRTANDQLRKVGFTDIQGIAFINFNSEHKNYELLPKIVEKELYDKMT